MKIIYSRLAEPFSSVEDAIQHKLYPDAYSYEGKLEKLEKQIELLQEMTSALIEIAFGESSYRLKNKEKVEKLLGYGYEVEE